MKVMTVRHFSISYWLVMAIFALPAFWTWPKAQPALVAQSETRKVTANYWQTLPKHAVIKTAQATYKNEQMTQHDKTLPAKSKVLLASLSSSGKSFVLNDGSYITADKAVVESDVIKSQKDFLATVTLLKDSAVFYAPYTLYDDQVYSHLKKGQQVQTRRKATTLWGDYYEVIFEGGKTGWIDSRETSSQDAAMSRVQGLLNTRYKNANYGIYIKYLDNDSTASINPDKRFYSASLSKLPILYWTQKRLNEGEASLSDSLIYSQAVNSMYGAFQPEGTGFLPKSANNQPYTLLEVINRTAKDSDNVASNMLAYYETGQFNADYQKTIERVSGGKWDIKQREATSKMVAKVLEGLYQEGGACFNALIGTDYDDARIAKDMPVKVAHKIGTAGSFNNDAGIIFANRPYILVVESDGDTDSQVLTDLSHDVYEILK